MDVPFEDLLIEVDEDGQTLQLLNGSRWRVDVTYITTVIVWTPTATIRVSLEHPDGAFPYVLTNVSIGVSVRAAPSA